MTAKTFLVVLLMTIATLATIVPLPSSAHHDSLHAKIDVEAGGIDSVEVILTRVTDQYREVEPDQAVVTLLPVYTDIYVTSSEQPDVNNLPLLYKPSAYQDTCLLNPPMNFVCWEADSSRSPLHLRDVNVLDPEGIIWSGSGCVVVNWDEGPPTSVNLLVTVASTALSNGGGSCPT